MNPVSPAKERAEAIASQERQQKLTCALLVLTRRKYS